MIRTVAILIFIFIGLNLSAQGLDSASADKDLHYFLLVGTPKPETVKLLLENPIDLGEAAKKELAEMGGELIGYYFSVKEIKNYALMKLPGTKDMATLVYQRMSTGGMEHIEVVELIPSKEMIDVFKKANLINKNK